MAWFKFIGVCNQRMPSRLKGSIVFTHIITSIDKLKAKSGGKTKGKNCSFKARCLLTHGNSIKAETKGSLVLAYPIALLSFICKRLQVCLGKHFNP